MISVTTATNRKNGGTGMLYKRVAIILLVIVLLVNQFGVSFKAYDETDIWQNTASESSDSELLLNSSLTTAVEDQQQVLGIEQLQFREVQEDGMEDIIIRKTHRRRKDKTKNSKSDFKTDIIIHKTHGRRKDKTKNSKSSVEADPFAVNTEILEKNQFEKFYDVSKAEANDPLLNILPSTYRQSKALPIWIKEYFDWHRIQTASLNETSWMSSYKYYMNTTERGGTLDEDEFIVNNRKYLIVRCVNMDRCGGFSDRVKPLLTFVAAAAHQPTGLNGKEHRRIIMIRWTRPYPLENFLLPNEVNWTVPSYMEETLQLGDERKKENQLPSFRKRIYPNILRRLFSEEFEDITMMDIQIQVRHGERDLYQYIVDTIYGGTETNDLMHTKIERFWEKQKIDKTERSTRAIQSWAKSYRDFFWTFFKPVEPIQALIDSRLRDLNLIPGEFVGVHYRADYVMGAAKLADPVLLSNTATTVTWCATIINEGSPIFFSSDTASAIQAVQNQSVALSEENITVVTPISSTAANMTYEAKTPHHIEWDRGTIEDFYPTFVDLFVMGESKCMIMGKGGFGAFASLLSHNASCWYNFVSTCVNPGRQPVPSPFSSILPSQCCIPHIDDYKAAREFKKMRIKNEGETLQRTW